MALRGKVNRFRRRLATVQLITAEIICLEFDVYALRVIFLPRDKISRLVQFNTQSELLSVRYPRDRRSILGGDFSACSAVAATQREKEIN